ncbi:NUDIX hydrolase [Thermogladius sp. 4427co]|uniref:NUDIX hydrolase n=1 Tax=Thermogladius sp. 4427co TaxID=3450718 RepID=UPI003F795D59
MGYNSRMYPSHAIASVGCVVVKNGMILLVKRGYPPGKGLWAVPGGVIEAGESIIEASKRELYEETGLTGEPLGLVWVTESIVKESDKIKYHYVILDVLFDPNTIRGELRPGGDAVEARWFDLHEAATSSIVTKSSRRLAEILLKGGYSIIRL